MRENGTTIDRAEVMRLYQSILGSLSPQSINQWIKVVTEEQYMVIPTENIKEITDKWL